jgi:hypothetical protein
MTNLDTSENYGQDDKNFQNTSTGNHLSTQEISTESGRQNPAGHTQQDSNIPNSDPQSSDPNSNRYDSENLDNESDSESKDITEKDIEEDLIHNDPSEGFETDIDTQRSDETESTPFQTIESDQDNPVNREFEIGELGNEELKEDELTRDETGHGASRNTKPSQRKF